jgi:hypothetical protein
MPSGIRLWLHHFSWMYLRQPAFSPLLVSVLTGYPHERVVGIVKTRISEGALQSN